MATPQRLPIVNSDDGTWGDIIRQYIQKEHYDDGTDNPINGGHQKITVRAGTAAAGTAPIKLTSGTLMTAAEVGAVEFNTDSLYFTITTGAARRKVALYDDTGGATGDIYYRNSSGYFTKLPIGTADGQQLTVSGGTPAWKDTILPTATKTTSYTVSATDTVIFANATTGAVTITLPAAASFTGYRFYVKRIDGVTTNSVTIGRTGTDTIDGQTSVNLDVQYMSVMLVSNGSAWYIL
jgi:hypothetical protein